MPHAVFTTHFPITPRAQERLEYYSAQLSEWNSRFNLVAESTLPDIWQRHFFDSAQLFPLLPPLNGRTITVADMGSGAGFPGLVLAIMAEKDSKNSISSSKYAFHLIESVGKKADFLQHIVDILQLECVTIHHDRVESMTTTEKRLRTDVVTARALKSLPELLKLANRLLKNDGVSLFLKGRNAVVELTEARKWWTFGCDSFPSLSDPSGSVLRINKLKALPPHGHKNFRKQRVRG